MLSLILMETNSASKSKLPKYQIMVEPHFCVHSKGIADSVMANTTVSPKVMSQALHLPKEEPIQHLIQTRNNEINKLFPPTNQRI